MGLWIMLIKNLNLLQKEEWRLEAKTVPINTATMKKEEVAAASEGPTEIVHRHEGNAILTIRTVKIQQMRLKENV